MKSLLQTTSNTRPVTADGRILRSDAITTPSEEDVAFLTEQGIRSILDFRSLEEVAERPNMLRDNPAFRYYSFPISAGSKPPASVEDFPEIYRTIVADEHMGDIFRVIANEEAGVLYHCTAGKDRTGTVSAILHLLGGWSERQIVEDYLLTKEMTAKIVEWIVQAHPEADPALLIPHERHMVGFLQYFAETYGSAEDYLRHLGLTEEEVARLKAKMAE